MLPGHGLPGQTRRISQAGQIHNDLAVVTQNRKIPSIGISTGARRAACQERTNAENGSARDELSVASRYNEEWESARGVDARSPGPRAPQPGVCRGEPEAAWDTPCAGWARRSSC
jgi:hypothetical protein